MKIDHGILSTFTLLLSLVQEGLVSVKSKRLREVLVNRLVKKCEWFNRPCQHDRTVEPEFNVTQSALCAAYYDYTDTLEKVRTRAKSRNRYNQAPHLTQDTNGKVTTSQLDITNESQEVSPFPVGDHKESKNRRARKHNKNKTEIT